MISSLLIKIEAFPKLQFLGKQPSISIYLESLWPPRFSSQMPLVKSREAVPKTEVLEQPQVYTNSK
jgi:hypothetical protein